MRNKIFLIILTLLITSVVTLFLITFLIEKSTINKLSTDQLNTKITEKISYFHEFIEHREKLLSSITSNKNFLNFLKSNQQKEYIENMYISYINFHKEIFQLRYIDVNGNEIIRVDNFNKPILMNNLQNVKSEYYFKNTLKLKKGEYYFSNIELNMEDKRIQKPYIPTLRIATPLIIDNIKYGIVIINVNIGKFLDYLQDSQLHYVNLIYDDGKIIVNKYKKYNWSRDLQIKTNFNDLFPQVPKNFNTLNTVQTKEFYIKKLAINTKNKIFIILVPKKLEMHDLLYQDLSQNFTFLIFLILIFIPISYLLSSYIENYYQKKLSMEEELQKLRVALAYSPISVIITDIKGNIEYINPHFTKVTGYSQSEVIGQNPRILKSVLTSPAEYKELWETLNSKETWKGTFKNINKDGSEFWESAIITPILDDNNNIINFLGIKQEITKVRHLKEELKSKENMMIEQSRNAAMGEMISMIAHQWRQPLSTISIIASNILLDIELDNIEEKELRENSEAIIKQTKHLSKTIEDFRAFFKPNREKENIEPISALNGVLSIIGKTLENNLINIKIIKKSDAKIEVFSRELQQVLINIIKNAQEVLVSNNIENKEITITILDLKDFVRIEICDNAGGFDEAIKDKIFEPYFTTKDEKTGTGLGLYMCKTIVEKHLKGNIGVYNTEEGACFYIDLPIELI